MGPYELVGRCLNRIAQELIYFPAEGDKLIEVFISLQLPPPCSRSICIQYLLRHWLRQNAFELAQSQRPTECPPRLPEASLSTEYPTATEQLRSPQCMKANEVRRVALFARRSSSIRGPPNQCLPLGPQRVLSKPESITLRVPFLAAWLKAFIALPRQIQVQKKPRVWPQER
jgi:hypothetical protein